MTAHRVWLFCADALNMALINYKYTYLAGTFINLDVTLDSTHSASVLQHITGAYNPEVSKLEGIAMRVPTPNVSLVEFVFNVKKNISKEKLNNSFSKASNSYLKNILDVTKEKLVSIDFNHNSSSATLDSSLTNVVGSKMGKISAWYDNEWGFSNRMCDIARYLSKIN